MIEALYRFLKSVGYEHPIHSPDVHMPIGLITGAFVFFVIAILFKRKQLVLSARHASILALAFAVPYHSLRSLRLDPLLPRPR
jgi:uncharacterized membrane protein